jgi:hypothetical protein
MEEGGFVPSEISRWKRPKQVQTVDESIVCEQGKHHDVPVA